LLLHTFRVGIEDFEKVLTLLDFAVGIGVHDFCEIFHQAEISSHRIGETSHLAKLRDQSNLSAGLAVLVDEKWLIGLGDFLIVAGLVVLFVRDLITHDY
jgi:hypothetical protein